MSEEEVGEIFSGMDEDGTGSINYDEFLDKLRVNELFDITGF